jgi:hypothetical protein
MNSLASTLVKKIEPSTNGTRCEKNEIVDLKFKVQKIAGCGKFAGWGKICR